MPNSRGDPGCNRTNAPLNMCCLSLRCTGKAGGRFFSAGAHPADWVRQNGHLVLLDGRENRGDADFNANFETKKRFFANSTIQMARDVAKKYPDWTPRVVEARSQRLAKKAAQISSFSHSG